MADSLSGLLKENEIFLKDNLFLGGDEPNYLDAYINKGRCYKMLNKIEEAIQEFDKALEIKNDFSSAYFNKGMAYNALKGKENNDKAIQFLDLAIQYKDDYYEAYFNKGCILMNLGNYSEALKSFKKCQELKEDENDEECEQKIKECINLGGNKLYLEEPDEGEEYEEES